MSEFFLELFSEEIPADLQSVARENIISGFKNLFEKEDITYKGLVKSFSTPNRLIVYFQNIKPAVLKKSPEIRGPNIAAPMKPVRRPNRCIINDAGIVIIAVPKITAVTGSVASVLSSASSYPIKLPTKNNAV